MRKRLLIALGACLAPAAARAAAPTADFVAGPLVISTTTGLQTAIARDTRNTVHVVFFDPTDQQTKHSQLVNGTAVWTSTVAVDANGHLHSTGAAVALDSVGRPQAVFYDRTDGQLKHAAFSGGAWQAPTVIDTFFSSAPFPSLALNASGLPRVLYSDDDAFATKLAVFSGAAWSTFTVTNTTMASLGDIVVDSAGRTHVVFNVVDPPPVFVGFHGLGYGAESSAGNGQIFGNFFVLTGSTDTIAGNVSLALDSSNIAHITAFDEVNEDLLYLKGSTNTLTVSSVSTAGRVGFSSDVLLTTTDRPRVAASVEGTGAVLFACGLTLCDDPADWTSVTLDASTNPVAGLAMVRNPFNNVLVSHIEGSTATARFATTAARNLSVSGTVRDGAAAGLPGVTFDFTGDIASVSTITAAAGTYAFPSLFEGSYRVTPSLAGYGFQPANRTFSSLSASLSAQDFVGGPVSFTQLDNLIDPTRGELVTMTLSALNGDMFIGVYTLNGRLIRTLLKEDKPLGSYSVTWDGRNESGEAVASGIYLVRAKGPGIQSLQKVAVVK